MVFRPVRRKTVRDEIVNQIKESIKNGELKPGEKLPAERELAKMFNVGRSSVREAILVLHSMGVIKRTPDGTFVNKIDLDISDITTDLLLDESDYEQLYEARRLIETVTAELAAKNATDEDVESLLEILKDMDVNMDLDEFAKLDADFHISIAMASKNKFLKEYISTIDDLLCRQIVQNLKRVKKDESANVIKETIDEHKRIVQAIKEKNSSLSRETMNKHLKWIGKYVVSMDSKNITHHRP